MRGSRLRIALPVLLALATIVVPLHRLSILVPAGHRPVSTDRGAPPVKGLLSTLLTSRVERAGRRARTNGPHLELGELRVNPLRSAPIRPLPLPLRVAIESRGGPAFRWRC